jgi:hypothetical protein
MARVLEDTMQNRRSDAPRTTAAQLLVETWLMYSLGSSYASDKRTPM